MRKTLTAVTLLTAASTFAAAPMKHEEVSKNKPFDLKISGSGLTTLGYTRKNQAGEALKNPDIDVKAELDFRAGGHNDGFDYTADIGLDVHNDAVDKYSFSIGTEDMGTVTIGSTWSPALFLFPFAPGGSFVSNTGTKSSPLTTVINVGGSEFQYITSLKYNKVGYQSPNMSGFVVAGSYTPTVTNGHGSVTQAVADAGKQDIIEVAAKYSDESFSLGAGMTNLTRANDGTPAKSSSYNFGGSFHMDGMKLGASYIQNTQMKDATLLTVGASYTISDDWTFGGQFVRHNPSGASATDSYIASFDYDFAPHAKFGIGITHMNSNTGIGAGLAYTFSHMTH